MKYEEQNELKTIPYKFRPVTAWGFFWLNILYAIPVIGFIMLIIFSFSNENLSRRNHARSYFCIYVIVGAIFLAMFLLGGATVFTFFNGILIS